MGVTDTGCFNGGGAVARAGRYCHIAIVKAAVDVRVVTQDVDRNGAAFSNGGGVVIGHRSIVHRSDRNRHGGRGSGAVRIADPVFEHVEPGLAGLEIFELAVGIIGVGAVAIVSQQSPGIHEIEIGNDQGIADVGVLIVAQQELSSERNRCLFIRRKLILLGRGPVINAGNHDGHPGGGCTEAIGDGIGEGRGASEGVPTWPSCPQRIAESHDTIGLRIGHAAEARLGECHSRRITVQIECQSQQIDVNRSGLAVGSGGITKILGCRSRQIDCYWGGLVETEQAP